MYDLLFDALIQLKLIVKELHAINKKLDGGKLNVN